MVSDSAVLLNKTYMESGSYIKKKKKQTFFFILKSSPVKKTSLHLNS